MSTFTRFNSGDIVLSTEKVNSNAWTDSLNELSTFFTGSNTYGSGTSQFSTPTSSGQFFLEIFKTLAAAESTTGSAEFSIAYGHKAGSGSRDFSVGTGGVGYNASRTFNGFTPHDIYVINFERARIKQGLKLGSLNLKLSSGSSDLHLTDDSVTTTGSATLTNLGRQFNLVSGSSGTMLGSTLAQTTSGSYGFVYPDAGVIVMNHSALSTVLGGTGQNTLATNKLLQANKLSIIPSASNGTDGRNSLKLFHSLKSGSSFIVDAEEKVSSQFYFSRITNQEFNYSTNPSFTGNDGTLKFDSMANNPKVYITTVGLYNNSNELLAVAKLSQPLSKDFTKEALVRIKLDY